MKRIILVTCCWLLVACSFAQTVSQKLQKAYQQFESDSQLKHAISSLYVVDAKTWELVFDKNSQIGLADASTQKIVTAATAFELLGKDYRYKTEFGILENKNNLSLCIKPSGDPTLGSWRWESTKEINVLSRITKAVRKTSLKKSESIFVIASNWDIQHIPDGWIWQDIGNYYGSGPSALNWRENQYDLFLKSGNKIGDIVKFEKTEPSLYSYQISSYATSAEKGSGDNAYIYLPSAGSEAIVKGTIPIGEDHFKISGAIANPLNQFIKTLVESSKDRFISPKYLSTIVLKEFPKNKINSIHTEISPSLDSIIYWFLKKSINLYGESLIKTFAYEKKGFGATDSGVVIVKDFWKQKGIDEDELNISDGSGLSPINRVTTHAQVEILKYAKTKNWFPSFYDALPEYNGMKMKSGTISDVKAFCGYQTAKDGKEYIFSFIVNNYNGKTSELVSKMYKVLDNLK